MPSPTSNTIYGIINDAMHDAGLLGEGEAPNSEALATNFRRLNDIINLWQTQGLRLFYLKEVTVPLVASKSLYTIGPVGDVVMEKPSRILQGYVLQATSNTRRPLVALSWDEWMTLSQVTGNDSTITSYFVDKQVAELKVHFWNPPSTAEAANTVVLLAQLQASNQINLEDDMEFPQEWRIALRWGLADDIATGQPQAIMDRCQMRANQYREALENWDVEDTSTSFAVDARGYGSRRFR